VCKLVKINCSNLKVIYLMIEILYIGFVPFSVYILK